MSKVDVNITKKMTINTGNYSSIGPSISLTLKDVDINKAKEMTDELDNIASIEFIKQIAILTSMMEEIKIDGLKTFIKNHMDNIEDYEADVEQSWEKLLNL